MFEVSKEEEATKTYNNYYLHEKTASLFEGCSNESFTIWQQCFRRSMFLI